ncbi:MAG TPA: hypothetical protein ENO05_03965, partial [Bacteroides sp.]|nr:hypothetical protein [Bacteroides sp.]
MIKDRLVYIIPVILSLVITIGLVRMVPLLSTKYVIKEIRHDRLMEDDYWYYTDLDGDGNSERVSLNYNPAGNVAVSVRETEDRIINQFNLPGRFLTLGSVLDIYDINSDGRLDILVCTRQHDSLFLSVIDDLYTHPTRKRVIFIDRLDQINEYGDYLIIPGYMSDLTGDGSPEYVFAVNGGHSLQPRRVYSVDLRYGKVSGSPLSGAAVWGLDLFDIDRDGIDEIFLNTVATENFKTLIPYPDSVSWMMVLKGDLQFYRPPLKMNPAPSKIYMEPFVFNDERFLMVYHKYEGTGHYLSELSIYNQNLQILRSRRFTQSDTRPFNIWRIPGRFDLNDIKIFTGNRAYTVDF